MKKIFITIIFIVAHVATFGQIDKFYFGMYTYDYDNYPSCCVIPTGTDRSKGNDMKYLELLKDININLIIPESQLRQPNGYEFAKDQPAINFLDNADSLNIDVLVDCVEFMINRNLENENQYIPSNGQIASNYYGSHDASIGWHIVDEPGENHFPEIKKIANAIESFDSRKIRFVNLFPIYATNEQLSHVPTYSSGHPSTIEEYISHVNNFLQNTNVNYFAFDHYFIGGEDNLFLNLDIIAKKSVEFDVPYAYVTSPFNGSRSKNNEEFGYSIFSAMVYNAKGVFYWKRESCSSVWDNIANSGVKDFLKILHAKIINSEKTLLNLKFQSAYHVSNKSTILINQNEKIPEKSVWTEFLSDRNAKEIFNVNNPIRSQNGSKIENIVISFLTDDANNKYFWIFNKSMVDDEFIQLNFKENTALINILENRVYQEAKKRVVYLEPAEAKLFKITNTID